MNDKTKLIAKVESNQNQRKNKTLTQNDTKKIIL